MQPIGPALIRWRPIAESGEVLRITEHNVKELTTGVRMTRRTAITILPTQNKKLMSPMLAP